MGIWPPFEINWDWRCAFDGGFGGWTDGSGRGIYDFGVGIDMGIREGGMDGLISDCIGDVFAPL